MNIIEACKEMVAKGGEYVYNKNSGRKYKFSEGFSACLLPWEVGRGAYSRQGFLTPEDIFATDWEVKYIEPELKFCSFCGGDNTPINNNIFTLRCNSCLSTTSYCIDEVGLITAWNRRDGEKK